MTDRRHDVGEYPKIELSDADREYIELHRWTEAAIAHVFDIPLHLIGKGGSGSGLFRDNPLGKNGRPVILPRREAKDG
jgi:hypothetical protein